MGVALFQGGCAEEEPGHGSRKRRRKSRKQERRERERSKAREHNVFLQEESLKLQNTFVCISQNFGIHLIVMLEFVYVLKRRNSRAVNDFFINHTDHETVAGLVYLLILLALMIPLIYNEPEERLFQVTILVSCNFKILFNHKYFF